MGAPETQFLGEILWKGSSDSWDSSSPLEKSLEDGQQRQRPGDENLEPSRQRAWPEVEPPGEQEQSAPARWRIPFLFWKSCCVPLMKLLS